MKRMAIIAVTALLALPALGQDKRDLDDKKTGTALYWEGFKAETEYKDLSLALVKYKKGAAKAATEGNNEIAAACWVRTALCNEKMDPENIPAAQEAYAKVVADFATVEAWAPTAKEGAARKGVDVWLKQLHACLGPWRTSPARSPLDEVVVKAKEATWAKIKALDTAATHGLAWGLGHPDNVIRDFAADRLAEVVDGEGIALAVGKLNDPSPETRAGAAAALKKVYKKYADAVSLFDRARELERDLDIPLQPDSKAAGHHAKLKGEAEKLKASAKAILIHIPEDLAQTPAVQTAFAAIIADDAAHPQARREAAEGLASIGRISGPLVDALVKGMDAKDHNVREACVRAAGAVDTTISADKHKLADKLIEAVQKEPAKEEDKEKADWHNDEGVRHAAAASLESIALVKSLPALIEALDDNDSRVRGAAFRALREITRKDFTYEKDDKGQDKTYEADKPLAERKKGQAKWKEWWDQTSGVVVLVERFWRFQSEWKEHPMTKLFDEEAFLREIDSRKFIYPDPDGALKRAKRSLENFKKVKDVFLQDAVDIGALDALLVFIGGETDMDKKANAPTRLFVAEACAKVVEKTSNGVEKLQQKVTGGASPAQKAGGASALGALQKSAVGDGGRSALVGGLAAAEPEIKESCANALGRVGEPANAPDLARTAAGDTDRSVQVAALRAIARLKPKGVPNVIPVLGELIADEPEPGKPGKMAKDPAVREGVCDALGAIEDAEAMQFLLRGRRDTTRNVREAAAVAVQKVFKADPDKSAAVAVEALKDEKRKTFDRMGAALSLGESGSLKMAVELSKRIIDVNPPRLLKDIDPFVRIAVCQALGILKLKSLAGANALSLVLADEAEAEAVRDAAYKALCAIADKDPDKEGSPEAALKFKASDPKAARLGAIQQWKEWFEKEKGSFKDE